jgi:hypothetical protein
MDDAVGQPLLRLPFQIPLEHLAVDVADLDLSEVAHDVILDPIFSVFPLSIPSIASAVRDVRLVDQFREGPTALNRFDGFHVDGLE